MTHRPPMTLYCAAELLAAMEDETPEGRGEPFEKRTLEEQEPLVRIVVRILKARQEWQGLDHAAMNEPGEEGGADA